MTGKNMLRQVLFTIALASAAHGCDASSDRGASNPPPPAEGEPHPPVIASQTGQVVPLPKSAFQTTNVVLYQPDRVLGERLASVDELASYTKNLEAAAAAFFTDARTAEVLDIVVVIRPGRRSRVWFVAPSRADVETSLAPLREKLESVAAPTVKVGPVAFAISGSIAGAKRAIPEADGFRPPMPKEWQDATSKMTGPAVLPDGILPIVWP